MMPLLRESVQNQSERAPRYLAVCNDLFVNIGVIDGIMRSAYLLPWQIFAGFDILTHRKGLNRSASFRSELIPALPRRQSRYTQK